MTQPGPRPTPPTPGAPPRAPTRCPAAWRALHHQESFAVTGCPHTAGHLARRPIRPTRDAVTVARLRAAGAIPLGLTNTSELCLWMETHNRVYGRTRNPYDPSRIVGGSSGGEGAIVGAGGSPFGLAADVGGSIRMPAFFNGVFGHKPTGGLVPVSGQHPVPHGATRLMLGTGPIARRAEDLMPLLRLLAGPDGEDESCEAHPLGDPATVDFTGRRVLVATSFGQRVSRSLRGALQAAADALAARGAGDRAGRPASACAHLRHLVGDDGRGRRGAVLEILTDGAGFRPGRAFARWAARRSPHTLPSLVLAGLEGVVAKLPGRQAHFLAEAAALRAEVDALLTPGTLWLHPPYSRTAPRHLSPLLTPFDWVHTGIMNVLGLPATQVPLGLDAQGLPLGVQVAGRWFEDHVPIAAALALEEAFEGWVPPGAEPAPVSSEDVLDLDLPLRRAAPGLDGGDEGQGQRQRHLDEQQREELAPEHLPHAPATDLLRQHLRHDRDLRQGRHQRHQQVGPWPACGATSCRRAPGPPRGPRRRHPAQPARALHRRHHRGAGRVEAGSRLATKARLTTPSTPRVRMASPSVTRP
ncbi:MAG: amidase [bacterium]